MHRPRTLEELFDREERLATRGIVQQAELLGGDARDLLNLPLHFRRKPFSTSALLAGAGTFLVSRFGLRKAKTVGQPVRVSPWTDLARSIAGTMLARTLAGRTGGLSTFKRFAK